MKRLSTLTGFDRHTLERKLASVPATWVGSAKTYRLADAFRVLARGESAGVMVTLNEARTRAELARAMKTEMEIAEAERRLIPVEQVEAKVARACAGARQVVDRSKLSPEEKRILLEELHRGLNQ